MKLSEALSVLILIASALLLSAANKSQSAQPFPREKPPNQAEQRIQNQTAGYAAEQVADKAVTPGGGIESEHDRKKNSTGVTEQQKTDWMVWLTAILSFIALIQALIFFNQYRAMVFSARAQIVVVPAVPTSPPNQTHVVLLVGQPVANAPTTPQPQLTLPIPAAVPNAGLLPGLFTFAPNQHSEFRGTVLNIGNTPAYEFTFDCWMELITPPFEDFPKDARVARETASRTIYPNTPQWQVTTTIKTDHPMSQMEFQEFQQGQRELWVRVRVYYRDTFRFRFRAKRYADFGWRYTNVGLGTISKYQHSN
jgi:hypothetical protein